MKAVSFAKVSIDDKFWTPKLNVNRNVTIPIEYDQCKKTGRIDAFDPKWRGEERKNRHVFWDSDVAKWLEAACYTLKTHPDNDIAKMVDEVIQKIVGSQMDDGYLNMYFTQVEPEKRWSNLRDWHELYCAGHLMETAIAHFEATSQTFFLDAMCRYADYIDSVFGRGKGKMRGYPGHQEIELALMKLYDITGKENYKDLASYFIEERGQSPIYFDQEAKKRGENPKDWLHKTYAYFQAHLPVRKQKEAVGHAVRALYMYSGMVDVANATGDKSLIKVCQKLWDNLCCKRMFITGGVGGSAVNEGFTFDYDLPEETAYSETCAAVANVFFNQRMLQMSGDAKYGDVLERTLYNGVMSGISLNGKLFFYSNPIAAHEPNPAGRRDTSGATWDGLTAHRKEWYGCACCPPNIARLLASLGGYIYFQAKNSLWINLFISSATELEVGGQIVKISQKTLYPWKGKTIIKVNPLKTQKFTLNIRKPGWCEDFAISIAGEAITNFKIKKGFIEINRKWQPGDQVVFEMAMPVEKIYGNPQIRQSAGRLALQRGPIVYCLETEDNATNILDQIALDKNAKITPVFKKDLLGGVTILKTKGKMSVASDEALFTNKPPELQKVDVFAVPYCVWDNRSKGSMRIWLREV